MAAPREAADPKSLPRDPSIESSLAFLREGYDFVANRCRRLDTDAFVTRLMFRETVCTLGADAARMFYEPGRFTRRGALPSTVLALLQDFGSVATLDGAAHRHRKEMFMSLVDEAALRRLEAIATEAWQNRIERWAATTGEIGLHAEVRELLCRVVCDWSGIPLDEDELAARTHELGEMVDRSARVGPTHWRARWLRRRTERWMVRIVGEIRSGALRPAPEAAAYVIAHHREPDGQLLPDKIAAVELINVLRPTVAVARFIVFGALALHEHPEWRERIAEGGTDLACFVQEVRRFYPFFPAVAGIAREPFTWRGIRFDRDTKVILDLYGTDRDPRLWEQPEAFRPERFRNWDESPYSLIPQGGGDFLTGHRCPGEWPTIVLMKVAMRMLAGAMTYRVPPQDLRIDHRKIPALPASGFVISDVARTARRHRLEEDQAATARDRGNREGVAVTRGGDNGGSIG